MMTTKITMENTEMLKLKKSFSLFLCILFALIPTLSFSACKDSFEIVQSITYVTNGEKITKTSQAGILADKGLRVPSGEYSYNEVEEKYQLDFRPSTYINLNPKHKIIDNYQGLTKDDIGQTIGCLTYRYIGREKIPVYYTFEFSGWVYIYIRVKVIDNHTIIVKDDHDLSETTYTVTSYQITYFDEDK